MDLYLDKRRLAFIICSLLSFLFALICTFSNGWSTYKGDSFGLFSPDITTDNICKRVARGDKSCLAWLRATQAMALLGLLSHIATLIGLVLAVKRDMKFLVAGCGQFAVSVFTILGLLIYSFQSPYAQGVDGFDIGWTFKLSWAIGIFALTSAILGITDGTTGEGLTI